MYTNNRYHFAISNCTHCVTEDDVSEISLESIDASVRASTPILGKLPSPALSISNLMPPLAEDISRANKVDKKDKAFVDRWLR